MAQVLPFFTFPSLQELKLSQGTNHSSQLCTQLGSKISMQLSMSQKDTVITALDADRNTSPTHQTHRNTTIGASNLNLKTELIGLSDRSKRSQRLSISQLLQRLPFLLFACSIAHAEECIDEPSGWEDS